eukprot:2620832-Rhodomonas_salina.2
MHFGSSQVVPVYYVVFTSITISVCYPQSCDAQLPARAISWTMDCDSVWRAARALRCAVLPNSVASESEDPDSHRSNDARYAVQP